MVKERDGFRGGRGRVVGREDVEREGGELAMMEWVKKRERGSWRD